MCVWVTGNTLSIVVLGKDKTMRGTTGFLLQALAMADSLYLVMCLFIQTLNTIEELTDWWSPQLNYYWSHIEPFAWPVASFAQTCTVWTVVIVTADRWLAITRPLHAPRYSTLTLVRRAVAVTWLLAAVYNVPLFFERIVAPLSFALVDNTTIVVVNWTVNRTAIRDDKAYVIVYTTTLFFLLRFLLPLSSLAFFNTRLIQAIQKSRALRARRGDGAVGESRKDRNTLTLVVVVVVFVACEVPDFGLRIWMSLRQLAPHLPYDMHVLRLINVTSNLFLTVNSCSNVIIYILLGRKFRTILLGMICRSRGRGDGEAGARTGGNNSGAGEYQSIRLKTVVANLRRDDALPASRLTSYVREQSL